jgi:hypothetical protein
MTGLSWLGLTVAAAWQTALGRSLLTVSPATVLAGLCVVLWTGSATLAAAAWWHGGKRLPTSGSAG